MAVNLSRSFDRKHLNACLALAGYNASARAVARIISVGEVTAAKKLQSGNFTKWEMLQLKDKCNMDMHDFIKAFFPELLHTDEGKKYVLRDRLFKILTDDYFDKY